MDDDLELFWRASFVPRIRDFPYNRVPKVAFMFLTKGPIPLAPLWEMFFKDHQGLYNIYVHPHPSYVESWPENSVFYGTRIPSKVRYSLALSVSHAPYTISYGLRNFSSWGNTKTKRKVIFT